MGQLGNGSLTGDAPRSSQSSVLIKHVFITRSKRSLSFGSIPRAFAFLWLCHCRNGISLSRVQDTNGVGSLC